MARQGGFKAPPSDGNVQYAPACSRGHGDLGIKRRIVFVRRLAAKDVVPWTPARARQYNKNSSNQKYCKMQCTGGAAPMGSGVPVISGPVQCSKWRLGTASLLFMAANCGVIN
ncbi:hypothetical protein E2C01_048085 [Portunus trituberculatus]|uniref:Uncharacterized protein n=1 Tax=Portunus trituberculatus TaxID=210409 RepID=A0A5B7G9M8_PORTR|nr:hypothetical protein [Portunus trituberculatus]